MTTPRLILDILAWDAGFAAGEAGNAHCPYPAGTTKAWSWYSGHVEGDAKRQGCSYTRPHSEGKAAPQPYIVCPKCGMVSHNPNDVRERYCGNCHSFHDSLG